MGGVDISIVNKLKLLEFTIDHKLTFSSHLEAVCKKEINIYKQLARAARENWRLNPDIIKSIYTAADEPIILYTASAWAPTVNKLWTQKQLKDQRGFAQILYRAHCTVSLNLALLLAGIPSLDLLEREVASLYRARRGRSLPALKDSEMEYVVCAIDLPYPAEQSVLEFSNLVDEEQYLQIRNFAIHLFTDGNKIEGNVGAALSMWDGNAEPNVLKLTLQREG